MLPVDELNIKQETLWMGISKSSYKPQAGLLPWLFMDGSHNAIIENTSAFTWKIQAQCKGLFQVLGGK